MSEQTLVGAFFFSWLEPEGEELRPKHQGQIIDLIGEFAFVQYFDWMFGETTRCELVRVSDICEKEWTLFVDHDDFIQFADDNIHGKKFLKRPSKP